MEEFCGSDFWNLSITWNATSQPDFLPCFENTVLLWIPCMFLWCLSPLETHYLIQSKDRNIPWSFFNFTKIISSIGILIAQLTLLIYNISNNSDDYIYGADFLAPSLLIITILLQMIFVIMEKKRGIQSSAYLFLFWFLMALFGAAKFRTLILGLEDGVKQENQMDFVVYMIYYPLVLIMFFLNFFADKRPKYLYHPRGEHACPEEDSSFFSRLTFSWLDRLIWRGYRKPITQEMLWDLPYINSSQKIKKDWDKHWETTMKKSLKKGESHSRATYANDSKQVYLVGTSGDKNHYVSILPTMVKTFGLQFLMGSFLKLIHDLLQFISPLIINVLIRFADTESADPEPEWRGYVYAVTLLFVTQAQSFFLGQYFVRMFLVGLKIRTAVISAVYRKALKISNSARKESTVGEIVNLMSVDAQRFMDLITYLNMIWSAPLQIGLSLYFLWEILGASVLAGLAVMIILIPINGYIANQQKRLQISQMKFKDNRVKLMNEILNGIKVLKLYAWEPSFEEQVLNIRKKEVKVLKKAAYLNAGTSFIWTCTPFMVTFVMFLTYVLSDPLHILTPDKVFVSITLLNIMRMPMTMFPFLLISTVQAQVSLKRMNKFINADELDPNAVSRDGSGNAPVTIENGTFSWGHSEEDKSVLKGIDVKIKEKTLVGVVGTVGAGKSSLCSAILGEMEKISGKVSVKGSVAYVPQQAWIQNATLEDNILFGKNKEAPFYEKVIDACALRSDFDILPAGDKTEIGEKGINLSGGQKQRVSLARSVYSDAEIFLLDDPLSAVDSHVGKHIFENVIGPTGILKNKTRILVTHGLTYLRKMDQIIVLKNGEISEQGTYAELLEKKGEFQEFLLQYLSEGKEEEEEDLEEIKSELERTIGKQAVERQISRKHRESESSADGKSKLGGLSRSGSIKQNEEIGMAKANGPASKLTNKNGTKVGEKLIETEKSETGKVSMAVYSYYIKAIGILSAALTVFFYAASQGFAVGSNVWLSKWSEDSNSTVPSVRNKYLGVYGGLGVLQAVTILLGAFLGYYGTFKAAIKLHSNLLNNVVHLPTFFFDTNPIGRILNRFSKDLDTLDNTLPWNLRSWLMCVGQVIATLVVICYATPIFIAVLIPTMILYYFVQLVYVTTSRQLKRIESVSRSPIYSHFGETIQGASSIRAYGKQDEFILSSEQKVDFNQVSYYPSVIANRWLAIRLEFIGNILTFFAALFAVMARGEISGGDVGLSVSYALSVTQTLNWLVRMTSDVETNIVAVERVKEYTETPQEAPWDIKDKKPPKDWPDQGLVEFKNYSTRYREGLDLVIKGIDCKVNPMEKVGIVGRTGAGKSSLTLALFRIIEPADGTISIDGVDVAKIGLHDLRSKLTIIPQDPVLFSGTLRMNLDPFGSHSDQEVWNALEHSHLKEFVAGLNSKLQHEISEGGENLSVGQRQLVCLARALLRKTKVLILDEATAAVDLETDDLIQETIRREFSDCTIITIAHRLNTIMDSTRVLVMDKGVIKEYDSPANLLQDPKSIFYGMAKDAGLV
ncbi:UNVERIFIED_CONTAM: hypothetical protein RMT77_013688 [Armadillidium vulgare]